MVGPFDVIGFVVEFTMQFSSLYGHSLGGGRDVINAGRAGALGVFAPSPRGRFSSWNTPVVSMVSAVMPGDMSELGRATVRPVVRGWILPLRNLGIVGKVGGWVVTGK